MKNTTVINKIEYIVSQGDSIIHYKGDNRIRAYEIAGMLEMAYEIKKVTTHIEVETLETGEPFE